MRLAIAATCSCRARREHVRRLGDPPRRPGHDWDRARSPVARAFADRADRATSRKLSDACSVEVCEAIESSGVARNLGRTTQAHTRHVFVEELADDGRRRTSDSMSFPTRRGPCASSERSRKTLGSLTRTFRIASLPEPRAARNPRVLRRIARGRRPSRVIARTTTRS
jgi:hypothetical protein